MGQRITHEPPSPSRLTVAFAHAGPGTACRQGLVRGFDLVVYELGSDDRFQDDGDGFWNHGGYSI
jgi:hypothetical protein